MSCGVNAKVCPGCDTQKDVAEFEPDRRKLGRYHLLCKTCEPVRARIAYRLGRERHRKLTIQRRYGLSEIEFDELLTRQGGKCAACGDLFSVAETGRGTGRRPCVDHDHVNGRVRGLLCTRCNTAVGLAMHDTERLRRLITYLLNTR